MIITYFSTGSGAFGAGAGVGFVKMLAQLFFTPSGMMLDVTAAVAAAVEEAASAAAEPQPAGDSSAGLEAFPAVSQDESVEAPTVSHTLDSVVGTDVSTFSLVREPFVCAVDVPRALPPLPRSAARPRPPLPLSNPPRPPRETREVWFAGSVSVASLALDRDRSFFVFETSPHCEIVPGVAVSMESMKHWKARTGAMYLPCLLGQLTISNAINSCHQITVCLLQSKNNIFVCPVGEHLLDHDDTVAVLLLQLAYLSFIFN